MTKNTEKNLKYFRPLKGQWLQFDVTPNGNTFDSYYKSSITALDSVFSSLKFTPQQAKEYLTRLLNFAEQYLNPISNDWYAPSVHKMFLGESVKDWPGGGAPPLREILSKYNGIGLSYVAKVSLHLLKGVDGGIEAKVVDNPTGIACECRG